MPGIDGAESLARARHMSPRAPRVMMSASPDLVTQRGVTSETADAFVPKPFETETLVALVRRLLIQMTPSRP